MEKTTIQVNAEKTTKNTVVFAQTTVEVGKPPIIERVCPPKKLTITIEESK